MQMSKRIDDISYSSTVALKHEAERRRARGEKVIDLGLGETKFGQPPELAKALIAAVNKGVNEYTYAGGTEELRDAVAQANNSLFGGAYQGKIIQPQYDKSEIVHATSAKLLISAAAYSVTEAGEDVLVLAPCWTPYIDAFKLLGINPVLVQTEFKDNLGPTESALEKSLTRKSKAILLNSPNNPSGRVFTKRELEIVYAFTKENDLLIISDEVYDTIVFGNHVHQSIASLSEEAANRTVIIKGLSKGFGMGGLRFGYAMSKSKEVIEAMTKVISNTITSPPSLLQEAAREFFLDPKCAAHALTVTKNHEERAYFSMQRFAEMKIAFTPVEGGIYIFPKVSSFFTNDIKNSRDFANKLVEETGILVHAEHSGYEDHLRIALIQDIPVLKEAWDRLELFVKGLDSRRGKFVTLNS
jgi:aspartate aminotransferase